MSGFQTYLDNAEKQTGITPREFLRLAQERGLTDAKPGAVTAWLKEEYGLGHGHASALARLITKGPGSIAAKHNDGVAVRLDGIARQ